MSEWIKCSDGLPEYGVWVECRMASGGSGEIYEKKLVPSGPFASQSSWKNRQGFYYDPIWVYDWRYKENKETKNIKKMENQVKRKPGVIGLVDHEGKTICADDVLLLQTLSGEVLSGTIEWVTESRWRVFEHGGSYLALRLNSEDCEVCDLVDFLGQRGTGHRVVREYKVRSDSPSDLKDNDLIRIDIDSGPVASYEPLVGIKAEDKLSLGKNQSGPFTLKIKRSFIIVFQDDDYGMKVEFEGDLGVAAKKAFESDWENVSVFTGEGVEVEWKDWLEVVI